MNATLGLLGSLYPCKCEQNCLGRSSGKETACSRDRRAQMASNSKDLMLSCSHFVLLCPSGSVKFSWVYLPPWLPQHPQTDVGAPLRHSLSPHSLLIQFAMPCCKEVESNSANEACFYKIHDSYLLQIYLFQCCSATGLWKCYYTLPA